MFATRLPPSAITSAGATDGQFLKWDNALGKWVPATIPTTAPGGSSGNLQYNNGGSFAGVTGSSFSGGVVTLPALAISDLTSGRVSYSGASGRQADSAKLLFDGEALTVGNGLTPTGNLQIKANGGSFYASGAGRVGFAQADAGTRFGVIQNDTIDTWSLSVVASLNTLGTPAVTWTTSGVVSISGPGGTGASPAAGKLVVYKDTYYSGRTAISIDGSGPITSDGGGRLYAPNEFVIGILRNDGWGAISAGLPGVSLNSASVLSWASSGPWYNTKDTQISRAASGTVRVSNLGDGGYFDLASSGGNLAITPSGALVTVSDGKDLSFGTTTGTKIGTATSQKLSIWNSTPIIQPAAAGQVALINSTGGSADGTLEALPDPSDTPASADALRDDIVANLLPAVRNNFTELFTLLDAIRTALVNFGAMKGTS